MLPDVGSTIVPPGRSLPSRSAASIIARPIRSLTEPPGFRYSSFASRVGATSAPNRSSRTIGVCPTRSSTVGYSGGTGASVLSPRRIRESPQRTMRVAPDSRPASRATIGAWNPWTAAALHDRADRRGPRRALPRRGLRVLAAGLPALARRGRARRASGGGRAPAGPAPRPRGRARRSRRPRPRRVRATALPVPPGLISLLLLTLGRDVRAVAESLSSSRGASPAAVGSSQRASASTSARSPSSVKPCPPVDRRRLRDGGKQSRWSTHRLRPRTRTSSSTSSRESTPYGVGDEEFPRVPGARLAPAACRTRTRRVVSRRAGRHLVLVRRAGSRGSSVIWRRRTARGSLGPEADARPRAVWHHRGSADRRGGSRGRASGQWRKCRRPVKTMAAPAASTAALTSSSRFEPPGWTIVRTPSRNASSGRPGRGRSRPRREPPPPAGGRARAPSPARCERRRRGSSGLLRCRASGRRARGRSHSSRRAWPPSRRRRRRAIAPP